MAKRVDLTVTIKLPDDHGGVGLSIDNSGNIRIIDNDGNEITLESVKRAAHYDRPKGKKYQSNISAEGILATINGLEELADLDSFIVVDTNSIDIENTKVSVAFFVVCRLIKKHKGFTLESLDNCGHAYEFHDVSGNPELLSIYRIANDTLKGRGIPEGKYVGFVTDTEMDKHQDFASGAIPVYLDKKLPTGFKIFYASSDSGQEITNKLIRFCDKESSKYLKKLQEGDFKTEGLGKLAEDNSVRYRYTYYPSLSITKSIVSGTTLSPDTKYSVKFKGQEDK